MIQTFKVLLAAAIAITSVPQLASAEELAAPGEMPDVTLLAPFTLYRSAETKPSQAIGALSANQTVHLAPIARDKLLSITRMEKVQVETWLGEAWINLGEGAYKYGRLEPEEMTLTLLEAATPIYDSPMKDSGYALSPQTVQAVASLPVCEPYTPCFSGEKWYLIQTSWLGEKWIRPYHYAEKYMGTPVDGNISVEKESDVYLIPYEKPLTDEPKLSPQIVKPVRKYVQQARMVPPSLWYQIETPKGLRWIHIGDSHGLGFEGVEKIDRQIEMPVAFTLYEWPSAYREDAQALPAQSVHAAGRWNDWYFIVNEGTGKWINPAMEIAAAMTGDMEHDAKLGVKWSEARIGLKETSIALDAPYAGDFAAMTGLTFTPQTVTASREWTSPSGEAWYYIHTWQGAKWVRP